MYKKRRKCHFSVNNITDNRKEVKKYSRCILTFKIYFICIALLQLMQNRLIIRYHQFHYLYNIHLMY
jgi:hypothetical protein